MAHKDGDGWIECNCGLRHWGLNGAAGILLIDGTSVLLQHRAPWVHNGDTWGIPGGAKDSHESVVEAAAREAWEEIGLTPEHFAAERIFEIDHGNWRYDTVIARMVKPFDNHELNEESMQVAWIEVDQVLQMNLHPSFAAAWPELRLLLAELGV